MFGTLFPTSHNSKNCTFYGTHIWAPCQWAYPPHPHFISFSSLFISFCHHHIHSAKVQPKKYKQQKLSSIKIPPNPKAIFQHQHVFFIFLLKNPNAWFFIDPFFFFLDRWQSWIELDPKSLIDDQWWPRQALQQSIGIRHLQTPLMKNLKLKERKKKKKTERKPNPFTNTNNHKALKNFSTRRKEKKNL